MIPIANPFNEHNGYNCFGCATGNTHGLQMKFFLDSENEEVVSIWNPKNHLQSYPNILHGGIQSTLMDEISSWTVYMFLKTAGVTSRMEIRYRKPISIEDGELKIVGKLVKSEKRLAFIATKILNSKGELCAEANIQFFTYPESVAREKFNFPGYEAFFS
jgi:uncharacterized protein (TIGR00369 family)